WAITEKSCLDAINELCGHIEAGLRVNRQTGLYEMVLFRDDWFTDDEIHSLAVSKIKSMSLEVANADEAINQLNVSYYNRDAIKDSSFSVAENASIRNLNGRVNAEDADFPYFMNQRNAAVVAQWKLKQMSSPVWSGSFTTAAYEARKWNRYDLLKLAWPRKWQGTITVRIMKINLGTGTDVSIDFVEVVQYSSELSSNIVIDTPIDVAPLPPQPCQYEPFEMPYYLAVMALGQRQVDDELAYENHYGLVGVVAEKPQNNSLYAVMMTQSGTEGNEWLRAATIDYEPVAELDQSISKTSTSFTVKNSSAIANVAAGTLIKCGSDWIGTPGEWMVFQSIDSYSGVVSVKRGALDSLPQAWGIYTK
ncbi:phage tail protein, partial [Acinetobacter sp. BIT-DXN8]